MKRIQAIILIAALSIALCQASWAAQPQRILSGKLVIEGSGDSQDLLRAIARRFEEETPGVTVDIPDGIGTRGGIEALLDQKAHLARASRPLTSDEKSQGLSYRAFAKSPVVFVLHPDVRLGDLKSEQIAGIYSGTYRNWKQLGGAAMPIYPVGRESTDPGRIAITEHLSGFGELRNHVAKTYYTASGVVETVARHDGAIGYAPIAMVKKTDLKILKVDGVYPLTMNVRNRTYKIVIPLGIVYKGELSPLAQAFADFLFSRKAQEIIIQYGCIPAGEGG